LLVMRWTAEEPLQQVPLQFKTGERSLRAAQAQPEDDLLVKPLKLQGHGVPATPQKNIFAMAHASRETVKKSPVRKRSPTPTETGAAPVAPPVVTPPPPPVPPGPTPEELAAMAAQQQREVVLRLAREHMAQYRYLGYARRDGHHQAFVGKGSDIYILQQGDRLEDRVFVVAIDQNAVTLRHGDTDLEQRIELKKDNANGHS